MSLPFEPWREPLFPESWAGPRLAVVDGAIKVVNKPPTAEEALGRARYLERMMDGSWRKPLRPVRELAYVWDAKGKLVI